MPHHMGRDVYKRQDMSRYSQDRRYLLRLMDDIQEAEDTAYWMEQEQKILNMNIRKES